MSTPRPRGGRRVRVEPRRKAPAPAATRGRSGALAVGAVVVAIVLLAIAGLRDSRGGASTDAAPTSSPVSSVSLGCPHFGDREVTAPRTSIATANVGPAGRGGPGTTAVTTVPGAKELGSLVPDARGAWASGTIDTPRAGAVQVARNGADAPGSVAFAATEAPKRLGGGLAVSACAPAAKDVWFAGAGSVADRKSTLLLTNLSRSPAVATVSLIGTGGAVEAVGGEAVVVDPGTVRAVPVEGMAAGEDELGVRVQTRRGALSAAMADSSTGGGGRGSDWIPASSPAATTQTITGLAPRARDRVLLVTNPGDRTATVKLLVSGKDGVFTPRGLESTEVRPGAVAAVELPASLGKEALTLRLTSTERISGAVRSVSSGSDEDLTYASAGRALRGAAVVPMRIGTSVTAKDTTVVLSGGPESAADATVTAYDAGGKELDTAKVAVPAGRTVELDPTGKGGLDVSPDEVAYLRVDPGPAPVFAAAVFGNGSKISTVPLVAAPSTTKAPTVSEGD